MEKPMTFTLRPMTEEDLPAVVAIENSWSYLSKWGIPGFRSALRNASTFACLVAEVPPSVPHSAIHSATELDSQKTDNGPDLEEITIRNQSPNSSPKNSTEPKHPPAVLSIRGSTPGLAGFAVLGLMPDHAELFDIVILPDYLGSGLGQLILDHCLQIVISNQLPALFLEVRQSNLRAIRFYEKNDFSIISSRKRYYQNPLEDAWVMKKEIPLH